VHLDDPEIIGLLIRAGAAVGATNRYGVAPLSLACVNGSPVVVEALLKAGADPETALPEGESVLLTAARTGRVAVVSALLRYGSNINAKERWKGQTPLMWAAAEGHLEVVKLLLEKGADIEARSQAGYTALAFAARAGHRSIVQALVNAGVNVNSVHTDGASPLNAAIANAHYELAVWLLEHGAAPNTDTPGWTPLHLALQVRYADWDNISPPPGTGNLKNLDIINALLARGADPNARMSRPVPGSNSTHLDMVGGTPFLLASKGADVAVMRLLHSRGADPLAATESNATALLAAAGTGYKQGKSVGSESEALAAVQLTVELGNDVNAVDAEGFTAMHGAAMRGANSIVKFLAERGARLDVRNGKGQLPLTLAEEGDGDNSDIKAVPETAALLRELMGMPSSKGASPRDR
jgi:ankyrin repeat protein